MPELRWTWAHVGQSQPISGNLYVEARWVLILCAGVWLKIQSWKPRWREHKPAWLADISEWMEQEKTEQSWRPREMEPGSFELLDWVASDAGTLALHLWKKSINLAIVHTHWAGFQLLNYKCFYNYSFELSPAMAGEWILSSPVFLFVSMSNSWQFCLVHVILCKSMITYTEYRGALVILCSHLPLSPLRNNQFLLQTHGASSQNSVLAKSSIYLFVHLFVSSFLFLLWQVHINIHTYMCIYIIYWHIHLPLPLPTPLLPSNMSPSPFMTCSFSF